jgi:hypothetical protein
MTNMSSTDHYDAAEKLLKEAESYREPDTRAEWCLELAKMHLALSQASIAASLRTAGQKTRVRPPHPIGQEAQQRIPPKPDPSGLADPGPSFDRPHPGQPGSLTPGTLGTDDKPARPKRR